MTNASETSKSSAGTFLEFKAYHDHQPGAGMKLRVTGEIEYPEDCYTPRLQRRGPGINPKIVMLNFTETRGDICTEVITRELVEWSRAPESEYDQVQILPDGPIIPVECIY